MIGLTTSIGSFHYCAKTPTIKIENINKTATFVCPYTALLVTLYSSYPLWTSALFKYENCWRYTGIVKFHIVVSQPNIWKPLH